jgi:hypothetical protein
MVNEVNKLIYNTIIKHCSINLPDIGTICVVRYPAEISSKRELTAPRYNVELSINKKAISIVDIIASEASVEANRATEIYSRWLEKSRQNNQFVIDRVGTIRDKRIDADKELITALNTYNKSYTMSRRNNHKPVWILLSLVVAVLIYIGAWKMLNSNSNNDVIDTILFAAPLRIVYVSCNPATQARDLSLLDKDYKVMAVQPVDMFPHTHHVENVVLLQRREE